MSPLMPISLRFSNPWNCWAQMRWWMRRPLWRKNNSPKWIYSSSVSSEIFHDIITPIPRYYFVFSITNLIVLYTHFFIIITEERLIYVYKYSFILISYVFQESNYSNGKLPCIWLIIKMNYIWLIDWHAINTQIQITDGSGLDGSNDMKRILNLILPVEKETCYMFSTKLYVSRHSC